MRENEQVKDQMGQFVARLVPPALVTAKVTRVNEDNTVAIEFAEGGTTDDCRLKAVVKDGNKYILVPTVGSDVIVGKIAGSDEYVVIAVHEITEVVSEVGNTQFSHTAAGFLLKKDDDDLLGVFEMVIEAVLQIVVIQGKNPDYVKLQQALVKVKNILRNA